MILFSPYWSATKMARPTTFNVKQKILTQIFFSLVAWCCLSQDSLGTTTGIWFMGMTTVLSEAMIMCLLCGIDPLEYTTNSQSSKHIPADFVPVMCRVSFIWKTEYSTNQCMMLQTHIYRAQMSKCVLIWIVDKASHTWNVLWMFCRSCILPFYPLRI